MRKFKKTAAGILAGLMCAMSAPAIPMAVYNNTAYAASVGTTLTVGGGQTQHKEDNVDGYSYAWAATSSFKRKTRYLSNPDVYAFYRPYWQDETKSTSTGSKASDIDITYQVHTIDGSWLPEVKNLTDYAGVKGHAIDGIRVRVSNQLGY